MFILWALTIGTCRTITNSAQLNLVFNVIFYLINWITVLAFKIYPCNVIFSRDTSFIATFSSETHGCVLLHQFYQNFLLAIWFDLYVNYKAFQYTFCWQPLADSICCVMTFSCRNISSNLGSSSFSTGVHGLLLLTS